MHVRSVFTMIKSAPWTIPLAHYRCHAGPRLKHAAKLSRLRIRVVLTWKKIKKSQHCSPAFHWIPYIHRMTPSTPRCCTGTTTNLARELKSRSEWITKKTPTRERETNGGGRKREKDACSRAPAGRQDTPRQTENEGRKRGCLRDALVRSRPASARFAYHCLAQRSGPSHSPSAPFGSRGHMRGERRDFLSLASMFASRFYLFYFTIKKDSQKRRMTAKYWLPAKNYVNIYMCVCVYVWRYFIFLRTYSF